MDEIKKEFRSGFVAIIGSPNVGKSTLLNSILKQRISIVTPKAQTTRDKIIGILTQDNYQIVFVDTPGIIKPKYLLQDVMMTYSTSAARDADITLYMVDAKDIQNEIINSEKMFPMKMRPVSNQKLFLIINKIDLLKKEDVLLLIQKLKDVFNWDEIVPISAIKKYNLDELIKGIVKYLPIHPAYYGEEQVSDKTEKFFVSEIIRENIFQLYSDEIPYSTTVVTTEFKERKSKKFYISAEIFVERTSQKGIIIGKNGAKLKILGERSRIQIEGFLQHAVFLELFVKVREQWRDNKDWLNRLGYSRE
ncbi:MAG: GTPase Era [Ignavibacteria bacterium]|nr:GTPase Era [Bacteroidota bacterium]MSQ46600.1 GTPase Era [Ignavibacteria bacterium]